jgi:two-component system, OmpR family, response regulator
LNILIVEDDLKIGSFIVESLKQEGIEADHAADGEEGLRLALTHAYDAAVVDLMLPGLDGLSLIEELRRRNVGTPVLILSARRSVDERISGLQRGGDDYLTKPFAFAELLARLQALTRRTAGLKESARLVRGDIVMDLISREVARGGRKIVLQPREFLLLKYFMVNEGKTLTKTMVLEEVWNYHFDTQSNVVDVLVCKLRGKLDKGFEKKTIRTLRGIGYVFRAG